MYPDKQEKLTSKKQTNGGLGCEGLWGMEQTGSEWEGAAVHVTKV